MSVDCPECGEPAERYFTAPSPPMLTAMTEGQGKEVDEIHDDGEYLYYHLKPAEGDT